MLLSAISERLKSIVKDNVDWVKILHVQILFPPQFFHESWVMPLLPQRRLKPLEARVILHRTMIYPTNIATWSYFPVGNRRYSPENQQKSHLNIDGWKTTFLCKMLPHGPGFSFCAMNLHGSFTENLSPAVNFEKNIFLGLATLLVVLWPLGALFFWGNPWIWLTIHIASGLMPPKWDFVNDPC